MFDAEERQIIPLFDTTSIAHRAVREACGEHLWIGGGRGQAFRLSPNSKKLLDQFTILANTSSLHPLDWKRFYRLVKEGRQTIPGHVLRSELVRAGFTEAKAEELAAIYHHLREYKRSA
ncbi:hypothetical protein [Erythrobacter aureus]|uniref:Uncharacterized protein n=1 Tax=Erythrobacter aureus TaxID=2182384 RepID=A0A345YBL4_9SPHN|nr:hypothetical protein [Erythrobacter aureus]AXK41316.1 hypothetical protein DVR09_02320 [Erythrobacter aureus]